MTISHNGLVLQRGEVLAAQQIYGWNTEPAWRLSIDSTGFLLQVIQDTEPVTKTRQLTADELEELLQLANDVKFSELKASYDSDCEDVDIAWIAVVCSGISTQVEVSGICEFKTGDPKDVEVDRFLRFREAIVNLAPTSSEEWRLEHELRKRRSEIEGLRETE